MVTLRFRRTNQPCRRNWIALAGWCLVVIILLGVGSGCQLIFPLLKGITGDRDGDRLPDNLPPPCATDAPSKPLNAARTGDLMVTIEARFLTVDESFLEEIGVDLGYDYDLETTEPNSARFLPIKPPDGPVAVFPALDERNEQSVDPNLAAAAHQSLPPTDDVGMNITLRAALLSDAEVEALIRAVEQNSEARVLSAPKVTLFNGQPAYFAILNEVAFVTEFEPVLANNMLQIDNLLSQAATGPGVELDVIPQITGDRRYVTMTLRPTVAALFSTPHVVIEDGGGQTTEALQPLVQRRRVETTVLLPESCTLVLGGQKQQADTKEEKGVPIFSKVPILSRFFDNRTHVRDETTLLILIKAKIIVLEEEEE